jgi:hypothetical protein
VFNPWDRALYLSVKHYRPFLDKLNFVRPFSGVLQTLTYRAISSGLYFPLEELFSKKLEPILKNENQTRLKYFLAGIFAGICNYFI